MSKNKMPEISISGECNYNITPEVVSLSNITLSEKDSFYMLLHHAMVFGTYSWGNFQCHDENVLKDWQNYLVELRFWNDTQETHIFKRNGQWYKREVKLENDYFSYTTESFLWGNRTETNQDGNYAILTENRGVRMILPVGSGVIQNAKAAKIVEKHFVIYNELSMPQVVDTCIIKIKTYNNDGE